MKNGISTTEITNGGKNGDKSTQDIDKRLFISALNAVSGGEGGIVPGILPFTPLGSALRH